MNYIYVCVVILLSLHNEAVTSFSHCKYYCRPRTSLSSSSSPPLPLSSSLASVVDEAITLLQENANIAVEIWQYQATPFNIAKLCDEIEEISSANAIKGSSTASTTTSLNLLKTRRSQLLTDLLKADRMQYIETVSFLSTRIPRNELPNAQNIPINANANTFAIGTTSITATSTSSINNIVSDCILPNVTYSESLLDKVLLGIFRSIVQKEIKYKSRTEGIKGLLEEGRYYMLSEEGTPENQHAFVRRTLGALMTDFLPPFYRIFMAGIVPSVERNDPKWLVNISHYLISALPSTWNIKAGNQYGPWFYAPTLTALITPTFLNFLVGPSLINLRKDGEYGGIKVEKCKFLQESGCKGLCLHQCKLPAQQFFQDNLGLSLTVVPNFVTQECQWSWGEQPLDPEKDPDMPSGCLSGCQTREQQVDTVMKKNICY